MRSPVLIFGSSDDPHVQHVNSQIQHLGGETLILDPWESSWCITALPGEGYLELWDQNGHQLNPIGIWHRLKPMSSIGISESAAFSIRERSDLLLGLAQQFSDIVINNPSKQVAASIKLQQLCTALKVGLSIPETFISNSPDVIIDKANNKKTLYKPLTWLATSEGEILFSQIVTSEMLNKSRKSLTLAPGIYQDYIEKKRELRITIIDNNIFCVAIYSQDNPTTIVDWRRNQLEVKYEQIEVPSLLSKQLLDLMKILGLRYGAIDIIEKHNGDFVFLEVNPSGNWLWLEDLVGIDVSSILARKLLKLDC